MSPAVSVGRALRSASFCWLLASSLVTFLGTGAQVTASAWLALDTAGGAFTVGLVLAARMLPNLLFGLAAGTLADRSNRTRLLTGVRLLALPPALGLAWLSTAQSESVSVWALVVLSFATGCATVFDVPARQALVLDTVPRDAAPNAMALNATASRLSIAVGALDSGCADPAGERRRGIYLHGVDVRGGSWHRSVHQTHQSPLLSASTRRDRHSPRRCETPCG